MNYRGCLIGVLALCVGCASDPVIDNGQDVSRDYGTTRVQHHEVDLSEVRVNTVLIPGVGIKSKRGLAALAVGKPQGAVTEEVSLSAADDRKHKGLSLEQAVVDSRVTTAGEAQETPKAPADEPVDISTSAIIVSGAQACTSESQPCERNYVEFELDSDVINDSMFLADDLSRFKGKRIELIGMADELGDTQYNKDLAVRRALAVKKMMNDSGITDVVVTQGLVSHHQGSTFRKVIIVGG
ncbi:MAG: hypothetical protein C9356_15660 [Oleiphilus sp.]|nr:MAG: hypothetical protein C9356_15660 [Oleiphilus sp.]